MDDADSRLEWRDEPVCDIIREPTAERQFHQSLIYTNFLETPNFLKKISSNEDFKELISLSNEQYERLYHEELALRFISLYKNLDNVHTSIGQHMTHFMKDALDSRDFDYPKYENLFYELFALLKPLGKQIFRQRDGNFATSLYDVITI